MFDQGTSDRPKHAMRCEPLPVPHKCCEATRHRHACTATANLRRLPAAGNGAAGRLRRRAFSCSTCWLKRCRASARCLSWRCRFCSDTEGQAEACVAHCLVLVVQQGHCLGQLLQLGAAYAGRPHKSA